MRADVGWGSTDMLQTNPSQIADLDSVSTTILVAEDDPITRQLLKRFLEEKGHQVLVAEDGEQAWSLFVEHHPRMVVTDWRMPKLDGLELCQRIREYENNEYTFVVVLTSTTDREAMVQGFAAGADDFMTKPFDRAELTWRIFSGIRVLNLHSDLENRIHQLDEARHRLEAANEEMQQGLQAAAKTQRALLPKSPPEVNKINSAWFYQPSDHLGGDSLNLFKLDETRLGFFVADVCGHGLPSALLAVSLHRVLTPVLDQAGLLQTDEDSPIDLFSDPGRVLTEVNHRFPIKVENGEYFTSVYCVIDTAKSELAFCGAGHPSPIILSENGDTKQLATDGFPIGFDESIEYQTQRVQLNKGDRIMAYSDGILEQMNPAGEMYGMDRLIEMFKASAHLSIAELTDNLNRDIRSWSGSCGQQDDLSFISIEFDGQLNSSVPISETSTETIAAPSSTASAS